MTEFTVERRPGRVLFVTGLLSHRAVVESLAELLIDPEALELARAVAAVGAQHDPSADDAYDDAMNALAEHLAPVGFMFHDWDLESVADAVSTSRARLALPCAVSNEMKEAAR